MMHGQKTIKLLHTASFTAKPTHKNKRQTKYSHNTPLNCNTVSNAKNFVCCTCSATLSAVMVDGQQYRPRNVVTLISGANCRQGQSKCVSGAALQPHVPQHTTDPPTPTATHNILLHYLLLGLIFVRFMYSYCSTTLTEVFPCFFLSCKVNARV
jgi:hypothetical protein